MRKQLTKQAQEALLNDRALYRIVEDLTNYKPGMLYFNIRRNSKALTEFSIIQAISNYLQVPPGSIQQEAPTKPRKPRNTSNHLQA